MQVNQFNVTVSIRNPTTLAWKDFGTWDKQSGGGVTSSLRKYQPGGGQREIVLGGKRTRGDIVISKMCDVDKDWADLNQLEQWAGIADAMLSIQATRPNYDTAGVAPRVVVGKLTGVQAPEPDSESEEPGMIALTFTVTA